MTESGFQFNISLSVLNHLGRNLYRNFITVIGEAISNSWDADAKNVWIDIDKENSRFSIKDDGHGMTAEDFSTKFLKIGYSKRKEGKTKTERNRPYIGAKGIGKLALLSCAQRISVFTKTAETEYVGGVIDNTGLDEAIKNDLVPDEYPLETLNFDLVDELVVDHAHGTIVLFEGTKETIRNSEAHIKKLLAMSFKFSLLDTEFNIFVNGNQVTISDLKDLMDQTEFLWLINAYTDDFVSSLGGLKSDPISLITSLDLKGFLATVAKPRDLKITGTEERATVDLFVNGRLREKNILRHIPTQRIVESYLYGQIHFDSMDQTGDDPFTSSREGVVDDDENFKNLKNYLKETVLPRILEDWDRLRVERGEEGDDDNTRLSKKSRKARALYSSVANEFLPEKTAPGKEKVEQWVSSLRDDAEFNISSYVYCFLSENLVRKYIHDTSKPVNSKSCITEIEKWTNAEIENKKKAGISFEIRQDNDDLCYLGMDCLAITAEGGKTSDGSASLWTDALTFKPARNVVGHTGLLTKLAKNQLELTFENIKARVIKLISGTI